MTDPKTIRVVLADDHAVVRKGIRAQLEIESAPGKGTAVGIALWEQD